MSGDRVPGIQVGYFARPAAGFLIVAVHHAQGAVGKVEDHAADRLGHAQAAGPDQGDRFASKAAQSLT